MSSRGKGSSERKKSGYKIIKAKECKACEDLQQ